MTEELVTKLNVFELVHDEQRRGNITLALSFWQVFYKEVASISSSLKDFEDNPYLVFEHNEPERVGRWPVVPDSLSITCDQFKFTATFDPISHTVIYFFTATGLVPALEHELVTVSSGTVSVSLENGIYRTVALPPIEQIPLDDMKSDYDSFWKIAASLAHWACASLVLREARANHLRKVVQKTS